MEECIRKLLETYKNAYITNIQELVEASNLKDVRERYVLKMALLIHNREILEKRQTMANRLSYSGNKSNACVSKNLPTRSDKSSSIDDEVIKNIIACDDREHLIILLEYLITRYPYLEVIKRVLEGLKMQLLYAETLIATDDEWREFCEGEVSKIKWLIDVITTSFTIEENVNKEVSLNLAEEGNLHYLMDDNSKALVWQDIEKEPKYYGQFAELFQHIRSGEALTCNDYSRCVRLVGRGQLNNIYVAKGSQTAIVFSMVSSNIYAIIGAYVRKEANTSGTKEFIDKRITDFMQTLPAILKSLKDSKVLVMQANFDKEIQASLRGRLR